MDKEKAVRRLTEVVRRKDLTGPTERPCSAWLWRYGDDLGGLPQHLPRKVQPPAPEFKGFTRQKAKTPRGCRKNGVRKMKLRLAANSGASFAP